MSFSIYLKKNEQGTYDVTSTSPETLPDRIDIHGHVENTVVNGEPVFDVVDLTVRAKDLVATAGKRQQYFVD